MLCKWLLEVLNLVWNSVLPCSIIPISLSPWAYFSHQMTIIVHLDFLIVYKRVCLHNSIYIRYFPEPQFNEDQALDKVSVHWEQKESTLGKCLIPYAQWFYCIEQLYFIFSFSFILWGSWSAKKRCLKVSALL